MRWKFREAEDDTNYSFCLVDCPYLFYSKIVEYTVIYYRSSIDLIFGYIWMVKNHPFLQRFHTTCRPSLFRVPKRLCSTAPTIYDIDPSSVIRIYPCLHLYSNMFRTRDSKYINTIKISYFLFIRSISVPYIHLNKI